MAIIYFGTFDPFHENHYRMAKYLLNFYQPKRLFIIPNSDNILSNGSGFKQDALSLEHRVNLIKLRINDEKNVAIASKIVIYSPDIQTNWYGRKQIGYRIGKEYNLPILYVVIGSDSLESTLNRSNGYNNPILKFPFKILTLQRLGYQPSNLSSHSKIVVDCNYSDEFIISSTLIRQLIRQGLPIKSNLCHPKIIEYLEKNGLYKTYTPILNLPDNLSISNIQVIGLIGPPGCGKTTIGQQLSNQLNCQFISTGEIYRKHMENNTEQYLLLKKVQSNPLEFRYKLAEFMVNNIFQLLQEYEYTNTKCTKTNQFLVIEGFKAGDLINFTKYFTPIQTLVKLTAEYDILLERIISRSDDRADKEQAVHRITKYTTVYQPEIDCEIDFLVEKGLIWNSVSIDNQSSVETAIGEINHLI